MALCAWSGGRAQEKSQAPGKCAIGHAPAPREFTQRFRADKDETTFVDPESLGFSRGEEVAAARRSTRVDFQQFSR
jgi:hypothetical protein